MKKTITLADATLKHAEALAKITNKSSSEIIDSAINKAIQNNFKPPLLVLQMGKVGSSSIVNALIRSDRWHIVHIHHMNEKRVGTIWRRNIERGQEHPPNLMASRALLDWLPTYSEKIEIVSAVRDPMARNLSAFYENAGNFLTIRKNNISESPQETAQIFLKKYRHANALDWFDANLKKTFGLDVYKKPFNHTANRLVMQNKRGRLIILRAEDSDESKIKNISRHLNLSNVTLERDNDATQKFYADHYKQVKSLITVPEGLLDQIYGSRLARHFYTENELADFRKKWLRLP